MGKSTPEAPTPANPVTVSNAQTTSNIGTAAAQQAANNVNQVGPNGSVSYNQTGSYTDPTTGTQLPTYTQTTQLDPLSQAILTGTKQVGSSLVPTAQRYADMASSSAQPLNFNTAFSNTLNTSPQLLDKQASDAIYNQQASYLDPQFNTQERQLQDQLARRGIDVGSEAYSGATTNFNNNRNQAYGAARDSAIAGGSQAANNMFGMALQGQNQNIAQQQLAQSNPLSMLNKVYGGTSA